MIKVEIINKPIPPFISDDSRKQVGAELVFNGRVRNTENGKEIIALEYEQYEGMAELELKNIAQLTCEKFPKHD